jgi:hypothetical protein
MLHICEGKRNLRFDSDPKLSPKQARKLATECPSPNWGILFCGHSGVPKLRTAFMTNQKTLAGIGDLAGRTAPLSLSALRKAGSTPGPRFTVAPIAPGDTTNLPIEFCRVPDAQRLWGLKRGIIYRKIADGTIISVNIREPGRKFGCRLLYVPSIRAWLASLMEEQNPGK